MTLDPRDLLAAGALCACLLYWSVRADKAFTSIEHVRRRVDDLWLDMIDYDDEEDEDEEDTASPRLPTGPAGGGQAS